MTLATWIALFRNLLCVVKTLSPTTVPFMSIAFPKAVYPINQIIIIEFFISLTQLSAVILFILSSYQSIVSGFRDYERGKRLLIGLDKLSVQGGTFGSAEYTILRHAISKEKDDGVNRQIVGFWEFVIGSCFVFLMNNTLHLHGPTHPLPLIRALLVMEIGLSYFLYLMWLGILQNISSLLKANKLSKRLDELLRQLQDAKSPKTPDYSELRILQIASEVGYLNNLMEAYKILDTEFASHYHRAGSSLEGLREDLGNINVFLTSKQYLSAANVAAAANRNGKDECTRSLSSYKKRLEKVSSEGKLELFCNIVIFLLNFVAFYGYMMAILPFYYPNASLSDDASSWEYFTSLFCFNFSTTDSEYYGVLAGDIAWTLEPAFVLFVVPFLKASSPIKDQTSKSPKALKEKKNN